MAKSVAFGSILVLDVSRWGRFQDPDQAAHYEFLCREAGVQVRYCSEAFENDGTAVTALVKQMKREGGFTLPSFGTFRVGKTKARKALNPRTGEAIKVKAGKTVRFKASPTLKKTV